MQFFNFIVKNYKSLKISKNTQSIATDTYQRTGDFHAIQPASFQEDEMTLILSVIETLLTAINHLMPVRTWMVYTVFPGTIPSVSTMKNYSRYGYRSTRGLIHLYGCFDNGYPHQNL